MRARFFKIAAMLAAVFVSFDFSAARAAEEHPAEQLPFFVDAPVTIGGEEYSKAKLIRDFLEVAFSRSFWIQGNTDGYPEYFERMIKYFPGLTEGIQKVPRKPDRKYADLQWMHSVPLYYPWAEKYLLRTPESFPREGVINKFPGEITIGIDWPRYQKHIGQIKGIPIGAASGPSPLLDSYPFIQTQIEKLIPELERATGRHVRLLLPTDREDQTENFARIRVIPTNRYRGFYRKSYFTDPIVPDVYPALSFKEDLFLGRVEFARRAEDRVSGYLLPESDNTMGMTVCKINPQYGEEETETAIKECLVRALGLPGLSTVKRDTLLGDWTEQSEKGRDITPYDLAMVRLLYCPAIKPGMGRYEVIAALTSHDECFKP